MTQRLNISVVAATYDRVQALRDGRVRIEGCDHTFLTTGHEQMFLRAIASAEYDVVELSMGSYLTSLARGESGYVAIPVFLSRLFRHSAIYIREGSGIAQPSDLAGKRVGVPEYQMTAALWARGLLDDEYGVPPSAMHWFQGGLQEPGRHEKVRLELPASIRMEAIRQGATLGAMLLAGELDALITARTPLSFERGEPHVKRLFPDYRLAERTYFTKTGIFPIMHVVVIRKALAKRHPWLPNAVFDAFCEAKDAAVEHFSNVAAQRVTLPWFAAELEETRRIMGENFWPYGVDDNSKTLLPMLGYAHRHGMTQRQLTLEEVFAPSTLVEHKI